MVQGQAATPNFRLLYGGVSRRVHAVAGRLTTDRRFRQRVELALGVKVKA